MKKPTSQSFAVVSDIHANAAAMRSAKALLEQRRVERVIILGDLLTYGCQPEETLSLLIELISKFNVTLISGNHDRYYRHDSPVISQEIASLPEWIQESISWTKARFDQPLFRSLPWKDDLLVDGLFFHHAHPFGELRWDYLSNTTVIEEALEVLTRRKLAGGVFGHTHRPMLAFRKHEKLFIQSPWEEIRVAGNDPPIPIILNPGSLGQPRTAGKCSTIMLMSFSPWEKTCELVPVLYDERHYREAVAGSSLSAGTKTKLLSFFTRPSPPSINPQYNSE